MSEDLPKAQTRPSGSNILADTLKRQGATSLLKRGSIIRDFREEKSVYFVDEGFCISKKTLRNGRQQTVSIFVPGDIIDHELVTIGEVFSSIHALTDVVLTRVSTSNILQALAESPLLSKLFHRHVAYQGVLAHEWLLRIGRLKAEEKTAHLLCELFYRLRLVGGIEDNLCPLAISQHELSDMLGLSVVQQNRSLGRLQKAGLLEWRSKGFVVLDWSGLRKVAQFDEAYLGAALDQASDLFRTGSAPEPSIVGPGP